MKNTNIGICFGGYCPLHHGHLDVIMQAKKENDVCYVIVCGYNDEPRSWEINLTLDQRFEIIKDFFKDDEQIRVRKINDTELGIDESMSDHNWTVWQKAVKHIFGNDWIYPSDEHLYNVTWYVAEPFYKQAIERTNILDAKVVLIDKLNPVSGTAIRKNPIPYWNKITAPFKKYLTKNILVIGTASEGKSTLVRDISRYFDIPYAEEFGRVYMGVNNLRDQDLTVTDFEAFLIGQNELSLAKIKSSKNGLFISDTDALVTLMYAKAYVEDEDIMISQTDYGKRLVPLAEKILSNIKWDHIFIFPPNKEFIDDGCRYMVQSSMNERQKNFSKLMLLVNKYYDNVPKSFMVGSFLENFNEVKNYINGIIEGK